MIGSSNGCQRWICTFENLTNSVGVLVVSGTEGRELMKEFSKDDFSNENFKWLVQSKLCRLCTR
jgi:glycine cleavage system aminomethyltransferase T